MNFKALIGLEQLGSWYAVNSPETEKIRLQVKRKRWIDNIRFHSNKRYEEVKNEIQSGKI